MTQAEIQLLLSATALLLTPFLSALVVRHQLRHSYLWWVKQQESLRAKEYSDRRYQLYERAAKLLPSLNSLLFDEQIFLFAKNECEFLLTHCVRPDLVNREFTSSELDRFNSLIIDGNKLIRDGLSELLQIGFITRSYYGNEISLKLLTLDSKMRESRGQVVPIGEMIEYINRRLQDGVEIGVARSELGKEFDNRLNQRSWEAFVPEILDRMFSIASSPEPLGLKRTDTRYGHTTTSLWC